MGESILNSQPSGRLAADPCGAHEDNPVSGQSLLGALAQLAEWNQPGRSQMPPRPLVRFTHVNHFDFLAFDEVSSLLRSNRPNHASTITDKIPPAS